VLQQDCDAWGQFYDSMGGDNWRDLKGAKLVGCAQVAVRLPNLRRRSDVRGTSFDADFNTSFVKNTINHGKAQLCQITASYQPVATNQFTCPLPAIPAKCGVTCTPCPAGFTCTINPAGFTSLH
jgi:hypothetical protein